MGSWNGHGPGFRMAGFLLGAVRMLLAVQAAQAAVVGTVRDGETGQPLAGAVVTLSDLDRAVATDAHGRYVLRDVPPGPQHLGIRSIGYARRTLHALVPREGALEINVSLPPEPIPLETLEVRPPVAVRGVERADGTTFPDRGISIAAVRNHPLLAEPDVFQALGGGEVVVSPESPTGVHVRGGASDQTAYLLDGIPVLSPYHAAGVFSAWNPDALSRLRLSSASPSPALPDALSGVVAAVTRAPGPRLGAQGSLGTAQARLTVDGPLGVAGAGYLLSVRSGFPGVIAPKDEASYLSGETGDWLAKIEAPAFGGRLRVLRYDSQNEIQTSVAAEVDASVGPDPGRNDFEWHSRSMGVEWTRGFAGVSLRVQGWTAAGDAEASWAARAGGTADMTAVRRDEGVLAAVEHEAAGATLVGIRLERSRTAYRVESDSPDGPTWRMGARTPVSAAFIRHARPLGSRTGLELGAAVAAAAGGVHVGPRATLRWKPSERQTYSGGYARLHQFAQSLRNAESVVGTVFPADLYMGADAAGIPVARSDQGVIAADYRPVAGVRVGAQAYARGFDGLLLVAPRAGDPFTAGGFTTGSGTSRGLSLDAAMSGARYGVIASYGWQRVRFEHGDSSYVPDHGAAHLVEAGAIVFPTAASSIRLGVAGALGRRTTTFTGGLEWESCNLLDRGCEFGGSPHYGAEPLGATTLPPYVRVDLSVRHHWHLELGGRDALIGLFGTLTNLFGHGNVLTYAEDPASGERRAIEMRPRAPLVAGLDWRF